MLLPLDSASDLLIGESLKFLKCSSLADKKRVLATTLESPAESEIRFLDYRLDVISHWPASERKRVTAEAISRRITNIARSSLVQPGVDHLMDSSCRLLDGLFHGEL